MSEEFLHGIEIEEAMGPAPPIATVGASVIGLVGTASKAGVPDANQPVLIAGSTKKAFALFGEPDPTAENVPPDNTIPYALAGILEQTSAQVVVVRVPSTTQEGEVSVDPGALAAGIEALHSADSAVQVTPRILIAPGLISIDAIANMVNAATSLRGIAVLDVSLEQHAKVANDHGTEDRAYFVCPGVKVFNGKVTRIEPASARVAGVMARSDGERGFWASPSNQGISGISGTSTPISFALGDANAKANQLNKARVATIIHQNGYRLWGNRTASNAFVSVRRTQDVINDSLLRAHLWAVDRNITKTYLHDVTEGVNTYLRHLKSIGAIIDGTCFADPEVNTAAQIEAGKVTFEFDFTPPYPAEHVTFRSVLVNRYLEELFA